MHNPFLVTSSLEDMWIIKMPCVMISEQNIRLYYRMFVLPTGVRSESLRFYSMRRGRLLFVSRLFSKEGQIIQGFRLIFTYGLILNYLLTNRRKKENL